VALARVLLREPRLLLLDEPTNHLDGLGAQALMTMLRRVPGRPAVFIISHDPTLIEQADRVLEMVDGRLRVVTDVPRNQGARAGSPIEDGPSLNPSAVPKPC
jgi:ATPase subunit of ABC transporter with duplicated ATPase domains